MEPTHEVTVTFTVTVPHELADATVNLEEVFEEEVASDSTLFVSDEDGEEQEVEVAVKPGAIKWREL